MADMTLPNSSTLDDVVESLKSFNQNQTSLQEEALIYAEDLNKKLLRDGPKMDKAQIAATEKLIATLESGKLDELEAQKEQLLRSRNDDKLAEERNDFLSDSFKQLKKQFKMVAQGFDEINNRKGPLGFLFSLAIRSAVFGLATGIIIGFLEPWKKAGEVIIKAFRSFGSRVFANKFLVRNIIDPLRYQFKLFTFRIKEIFGLTGRGGGFARFVSQTKLFLKDIASIGKMLFGNVIKVLTAITGLFTGRVGAFQGLFNMNFKPKVQSKFFQAIGSFFEMVAKPFRLFAAKAERAKRGLISMINGIGNSLTGAQSAFSNIGTRLSQLFSKQNFKLFFEFFNRIKGAFRAVGMVLGRVLYPILALIGGIRGGMEAFGKESDKLNNIIATYFGVIKGAFRLVFGEFIEFLVEGIGFLIDLIPGVDGVRDYFKSLNIADFFDSLFDGYRDLIINALNIIRDKVADIGVGGIIKNIMASLLGIFMKIAAFPSAIALAALSAMGAAMPGGESPGEAFKRKFKQVMETMDSSVDKFKVQADGRDADGNLINALSEEGQRLRTQAENREQMERDRAEINMRNLEQRFHSTTLVSDGGFGSRLRNFKARFGNRYSDD